MDFWVKMIKREFDTKPIACHLYVTDQCNLDCFYCTEYDNSVPHPSLEGVDHILTYEPGGRLRHTTL